MPDLKKQFDSDWVKAGFNTKQGDHLRFLDVGEFVEDKKNPDRQNVVFNVGIVRNGTIIATKKFQLNRTNFKAVSKLYGTDSDDWVKKEMMVNVVKRQNPQGEMVDAIALSSPGLPGEVDLEDEE